MQRNSKKAKKKSLDLNKKEKKNTKGENFYFF